MDEFYAIGGEEYFSSGISIIEWGELIEPALPNDYIKITFEKDLSDENIRYLHRVGGQRAAARNADAAAAGSLPPDAAEQTR